MTEQYGLNFSFSQPRQETLKQFDRGFNDHGVRENDDGSVDVIFRAIEAGKRDNGSATFEIPESFLQSTVNDYSYNRIPFQMDHSQSQMSNVGHIEGSNVWFSDGAIGLMGHIPNTGNSVREDVIADFTHEPPAIQDGSVQFKPDTVEYEFTDDENIRLIEGKMLEFSLTPFPGGYGESGGLSPAFSTLSDGVESTDNDSGKSRLRKRNSRLRKL